MRTEGRVRLADVFALISDLRRPGKVEHDLVELPVVAVSAVRVGVDTVVGIALWAKGRLDWLRGYLKLSAALPRTTPLGGCSD